MHLPASEVATAQTAKPRQAGEAPRKPLVDKAAVANICSDNYLVSATGARFDGAVRIDHPQLRWSSQTLQVDLPATGGRVERMTAEQDVRFELSNETQQIRGRSDRAVYSYAVTPLGTNDYLRLTGNPVLTTTNGSFRGTVILLDVGNQRLIAPEAYRIEAPASLATTNLLRLPQNRIIR
jgi:lipopolysaccharide export system protein LptA